MENSFKQYLVDYVGNQLGNDSEDVTVDMIVEVMAEEFPEFILAIAEENFIRGYKQAMHDNSLVKGEQDEDETTSARAS